jgi:hypothetical protein
LVMLAGCGGQQAPTINPNNAISITRVDGTATLARPSTGSQGELTESAQLVADDHLYTAANQSVTLQFPDGSTLQIGPESHLLLYALRQSDRVPVFRLLAGSVTADVRGTAFEVQAYEEAAMNFNMVVTDLTAVPRGAAGRYQLGFDGNALKATVNAGEFDLRSANQQATLPAGWQAIAEPGRSLQVISLITPTPAPPSATEAPTATSIPIISITPTNTPTATRTATSTNTPTRTRTPIPIIRTATGTATPIIIADTPIPTATPKPDKPPKPTNPPPQPTNPPPQPTNPPPQPTEPPPPPPPTEPPRPTPGL